MKENLQEPLHNQNKNEDKENNGEMDNKKKEEKVEEINQKEKSKWDFWYGFSLFGRIIYTLYSLHGLFFIYNFIIQYIIVFPSLVYTDFIPNWARIPFFLIYILFAINSSNILVIPLHWVNKVPKIDCKSLGNHGKILISNLFNAL